MLVHLIVVEQGGVRSDQSEEDIAHKVVPAVNGAYVMSVECDGDIPAHGGHLRVLGSQGCFQVALVAACVGAAIRDIHLVVVEVFGGCYVVVLDIRVVPGWPHLEVLVDIWGPWDILSDQLSPFASSVDLVGGYMVSFLSPRLRHLGKD